MGREGKSIGRTNELSKLGGPLFVSYSLTQLFLSILERQSSIGIKKLPTK